MPRKTYAEIAKTSEYKQWASQCVQLFKRHPFCKMVPSGWAKNTWVKMFNEGLSPEKAVRLCVLANY